MRLDSCPSCGLPVGIWPLCEQSAWLGRPLICSQRFELSLSQNLNYSFLKLYSQCYQWGFYILCAMKHFFFCAVRCSVLPKHNSSLGLEAASVLQWGNSIHSFKVNLDQRLGVDKFNICMLKQRCPQINLLSI